MLFYTFNETEQPNGKEEFKLTVAKVIFNISGTQEAPVRCEFTITTSWRHNLWNLVAMTC